MPKGSAKPALRFKGFTDAWEQRKFEDIAVRSSMVSSESGLPRVEYEDIISGTGCLKKDIFAKESGKTGIVFHKGDVLYGKLRPYLQNWLLPTFNGLAVGDFWVIQPQDIDSRFLYRLIQSHQFDEVANQSAGTKMPRADWKLIAKTEFLIPNNIDEQAIIGTYFACLDHLITLHQRKCDKLMEVKKSMLERMFPKDGANVAEVRFKGFTEAWDKRKVEEITTSYSGGTPTVGVKMYYGGTIPFIRSAEINCDSTELFITEEGLKNSSAKLVSVGDILYALYGATGGEVGRAKLNGAINQAILAVKPMVNYDAEFISQWLRKNKQNIVESYLQGGQGNLSGEIVRGLVVDLPSYDEQIVIGKYFRCLDTLITLYQHKLEKLKNIKKACLEKMFA